MRFGRCPCCRAMIYQNPDAIIYYCIKCRTPIRGRSPESTGKTPGFSVSKVEFLSQDTTSVFSSELDAASVIDVDGDQPPFLSSHDSCSDYSNANYSQEIIAASSPSPSRGFSSSARVGNSGSGAFASFDGGSVGSNEQAEVRSLNDRVDVLRPSSRRTRLPSSTCDWSIPRCDFSVPDAEEGSGTPRRSACQQPQQQQPRRRSPPRSSQELATSVAMSGPESPLTDPAFRGELLHAVDKLRSLIAAVELQPRQPESGARRAATRRRDSRIFRRLESADPEERAPRRDNASNGSSWSPLTSNGHVERPAPSRHRHCLPVLGAAPFVVCSTCSELLHTPRRRAPAAAAATSRLRCRCGACGEAIELTLHSPTAQHM